MLFQGAEGEQPPPSTHQWQHHPSAIIHMIVWNGYPTSFVAAVQLASDKLLLSCWHGCEKVMATRTEFHFGGWVYTFSVQLSSLRN